MVRLRCKKCHRRVNIHPIPINQGRSLIFKCPNFKCNAEGVFRNKNYIPFLFVKKITLASKQYYGILANKSFKKF